jgi:hypothetical protein
LLSGEWVGERNANEHSVEQREPTLPFEHIRITASIRIVHGSRFHLVACVESSTVAQITHAKNICRGMTNEIENPSNKKSHKIIRAYSSALSRHSQVFATRLAAQNYSEKPVLVSPRAR